MRHAALKLLIPLGFEILSQKNLRQKTDSKCVVSQPNSTKEANIRRKTSLGMVMDKRTFVGMVEAGEPLIQQAVDAFRAYHEAQDCSAPPEEIERLRLLAESLFQAVSDYQLRVIAKARGKDLPPLH